MAKFKPIFLAAYAFTAIISGTKAQDCEPGRICSTVGYFPGTLSYEYIRTSAPSADTSSLISAPPTITKAPIAVNDNVHPCAVPTFTTDGWEISGYTEVVPGEGLTNYVVNGIFEEEHLIGSSALYFANGSRGFAKYKCHFICGDNCPAFFLSFYDGPTRNDYWNCQIFDAPLTPDDFISASNYYHGGIGFNDACPDSSVNTKD